ncbi:hypothetical protein [Streptomyces prunicolor]|uniref:Secreted protein n=1 Tax=Streptomyces prunicolor TaxID=67348 RepID=A0ABU4F3Q0_9ACTN|nr:hypothetical protein [Streptomyces prunicolor]MDV7215222.1 hypothetical protein [Streptomyces prunicolor]
MPDSTLWVACLTAGTAITASWVTSQGSLRAAREQASAAATAQRANALAQSRRDSYIEVVDQAHHMGALYRELPIVLSMPAGSHKEAAVQEHAKGLREAYGPFTRACDVMIVDGGNSVAEAVKAVFRDSRAIYMCLLSASDDEDTSNVYGTAIRSYWDSVNAMVWEMHREANRYRV